LKLSHVQRYRDQAIEVLRRLDDATLEDLLRRAQYVASDGYPAQSMGESDVHGGRGGDPVGAKVAADAGGRDEEPDTWRSLADPVGEALAQLFGNLVEIAGLVRVIDRKRAYVLAAGDALKGRQPVGGGVCDVCGRVVAGTEDDRLRGVGGGRACDTDRKAWERGGRPLAGPGFEQWKRDRQAELGQMLDRHPRTEVSPST
jgi:hypothetical protein